MNILISIIFFSVFVISFFIIKKKLIDNNTINILVNIASIISLFVAITSIAFPPQKPPIEKGRLAVVTKPKYAKVKIIKDNNIIDYYFGIELEPGFYHIEVYADKFKTYNSKEVNKPINIFSGENTTEKIVLKRKVW